MSNSIPSPNGSDLDLTQRLAEQVAVERVRAGDALALEMIFTAYRGELLTLAQRIVGVREAAEDVVQDVFLSIWAGRERWHVTASLRGYLRRAVHNGAVRSAAGRGAGRPRQIDLDTAEGTTPSALADPTASPDTDLERADLAAAVADATRDLPPRAREVFTLKRIDGLSNREIAERLGLSIKTVEIHMTRALAALRRRLTGWRG